MAFAICAQNNRILLWTISTSPKRSIATYDDFSGQSWEYVRDRQGYKVVEVIVTLAADTEAAPLGGISD